MYHLTPITFSLRLNTPGWTVFSDISFSDHLGNTRLTFTDRNNDRRVQLTGPTSEITQQLDYYPFGLQHQGDGFFYPEKEPVNRYRYNGKEFSEELGLYDYGARWYDPAIGRWGQIDPLADKMPGWSPYNYTLGNPISFIDPDGQMPSDPPGNGVLGNLTTFLDNVKEKGFAAVENAFNSVSDLFSGNDSQRAQAATLIGSVPAGLDAIGDTGLESARTTVQSVGKGADVVEIAAISTTMATGGLSLEATAPIAAGADGVGVLMLLAEAGIDILQDGKVRSSTQTSIAIKATVGVGGHLLGKAVDDVVSGFKKRDASDEIVKAMPAPFIKIVENTSNHMLQTENKK